MVGGSTRALLAAVVGSVLLAAPAAAATSPPMVSLTSTGLASATVKDRSCDARPLTGAGVVSRAVTVPSAGWVTARLDAPGRGDWDLAIFGAGHRLVAASTEWGSHEIAQGIASEGERLTVQGCRRSGGASLARLKVETRAFGNTKPEALSLVRVSTPTQARKTELTRLALALSEKGGKDYVEVLLHGAADAARLRRHQFVFTNKVADMTKYDQTLRRRDAAYSSKVKASALPSGRDTYRR